MIQAKCIQKFRDKNNKIYGYRLVDSKGVEKDIQTDELKNAILNKQLDIINLTLTTDNRLIESSKKHIPTKKEVNHYNMNQVNDFLNKLRESGSTIHEIQTFCNHKVYLALKQDNGILIIPSNVVEVTNSGEYIDNKYYTKNEWEVKYGIWEQDDFKLADEYHDKIRSIRGKLKVVGGGSLISTEGLMFGTEAKELDLSGLAVSTVVNMKETFIRSYTEKINVSSWDTHNVKSMNGMFADCQCITKLDLSNFDTSSLKCIDHMFAYCCNLEWLNIPTFDLKVLSGSEVFDTLDIEKITILDSTSRRL